MAETEEFDVEALQAQIDLSLAATHNLVSSWIGNPAATTQISARQLKLENELKEHMKRPPRLGVGATVTEAVQSASREEARLRGHLVGKSNKRDRTDDTTLHTAAQDDSDEEESRAGAIRKKAKLDPFAASGKNKKKKHMQQTQGGTVAADPGGPDVLVSSHPSSDPEPKERPVQSILGTQVDEVSAEPGRDMHHGSSSPRKQLSKHNVLNLGGAPLTPSDDEDEDNALSPTESPISRKRKKRRKNKKKRAMAAAEASHAM